VPARALFLILPAIAVALLPASLWAEIRRLNLKREYPVVYAENRVWIGMPGGLYRYNADDDTYKRFTLPVEGRVPEVRDLSYRDEWLWCVLDSGLAALHIRLNEWLYFDVSNGLPSGRVNGLDFHGDYVWIATDIGAARYDLFIEEWETYDYARGVPDESVNDVLAVGDNVWLITDHLFSEYDTQFEKWRHYAVSDDTTATLQRGFPLGGEVWLVSDRGLTRFSTGLQTQRSFGLAYLMPENLLEVIIEDNAMWAITRMGLFQYDQASGVWREFAGNPYLKTYDIAGGSISRTHVWVLTERNVLVWDRGEKSWEVLDYASGLSTTAFASAYASGNLALLLNPDGIDYRADETDPWRRYAVEIQAGRPGISGRSILRNLFDNEEGGFVPMGNYRWLWEGTNMTFIYGYEQLYASQGRGLGADTRSGERLDIKSQFALGGSRMITGFYNNIDYTENMYGVRYRSRANDLLRELNWGDFRRESAGLPFAEGASVFGGNVWLQAGRKTSRFKRSYLTAKGESGERRSQKAYEHFAGATTQSAVHFRDIDYVRNQFYAIPGLDSLASARKIEVFIDDLVSANNTPNTREGAEIANIVGDYDLAKAPEDYYLYDKADAVRFMGFISPAWTIVARVTEGDEVREEVLQYGEAASSARKNFYYLNAREIIAYSFDLSIRDGSGLEVPLSDFGIDADGDGVIDSEYIDYENGIMFFAEAEPFPPPVYDPDDPESFYTLYATFNTDLEIIQLEYRNLVRGTELLLLDGIEAKSGSDYVLDYTNGTLVFVREGVVSVDTRIEIVYEYHVTENNTEIRSALVNVSPSDNYYMHADWVQFTPTSDGGPAAAEPSNLLTLHGEVRGEIGGLDLRVIPGLAYQAEGSRLSGGHVEGLLSSSRMRFQTGYDIYTEDYSNVFRPQFVLGDVKSNMDFFLTVDARHDLRLTGSFKDVRGFEDGGGTEAADRVSLLGFLLHRENWPGWEFQYQKSRTTAFSETVDRHFFQSRIDYRVPQSVSNRVLLEDLRLEFFLRAGKQSGEEEMESAEQESRNGFVRINADVSDRFQAGLFYRRNDLDDVSPGAASSPMTRAERLLFTLSHEDWRLLQTNMRIENTLDQGFHRNSDLRDAWLSQYSQLSLRLSPGVVWDAMSPLYFEFGVNQTVRGWGVTRENAGGWLWRAFGSDTRNLQESHLIRDYYIRNEFRPNPGIFINSVIEWNDREAALGLSDVEAGYWRWSETADLKVGYNTRFTLRYNLFSEDLGYDRAVKYHEPSARIEYRLTPDLQNTLYARYRRTSSDDGNIRDTTDGGEVRFDLIWRKQNVLKMRRIEIRQTFSGNHSRTVGYNVRRIYDLASSTGIDIYPIYSMILRFQVNLSRHLDRLLPVNDYSSVALDLRMAFHF
jgi:hypothetical protein